MLLRPLRVLLALVLCVLVAGCSSASGGAEPGASGRTTAATATATAPADAAAPTGTSGLPTVRAADLPPEARRTLALIEQGGPFPYAKDGSVFSNFERVLPREKRGYYREYTVRTPGERDRGARRIVTGRGGEIYWTDDHYETFREVITDEN
ncbi:MULTISPECIES: ribonuclease domain-containing protein [Streptomyces]|uniref:Macromolecule metabolism macromolecule degradation degradation of rna n=1 Tax=Streptomyces venezuelae (strain ATCC 10712 / CBS 650.69 / DSM 40230 / JCM 4526 / NBRC 13096 / PD 04745) TaxID=953739 RepID=F2RCI8_STRVP|nr:ribonuclease domain-containing protein [Streptomyces venezuelae]APE20448.1 guanine-specific ribonuclease N1 and T1 [Streptomyces venezuelae]QER97841.1 guanine-specific ribonuclease N1 and T1 [Streptomyces venezuelae ATCC 10712]CCA54346.1 macromolecule metabolism; macromolecule degradation; degradation of rna [Streptomyces venezuelae ATCC 10712]